MDRLTIKYVGEYVLRDLCTFGRYASRTGDSSSGPDDCINCEDVCEINKVNGCIGCPLQKAFDRLAEYEDADEKIREMYEDHFELIDLAKEYIKQITALNGGKDPRNIIYLSDEDADKWKAGLNATCHCGECTHKEWSGNSGRVYCPKTHSWRDADDFCKFAEKSMQTEHHGKKEEN